jgi:hypothetical protein
MTLYTTDAARFDTAYIFLHIGAAGARVLPVKPCRTPQRHHMDSQPENPSWQPARRCVAGVAPASRRRHRQDRPGSTPRGLQCVYKHLIVNNKSCNRTIRPESASQRLNRTEPVKNGASSRRHYFALPENVHFQPYPRNPPQILRHRPFSVRTVRMPHVIRTTATEQARDPGNRP